MSIWYFVELYTPNHFTAGLASTMGTTKFACTLAYPLVYIYSLVFETTFWIYVCAELGSSASSYQNQVSPIPRETRESKSGTSLFAIVGNLFRYTLHPSGTLSFVTAEQVSTLLALLFSKLVVFGWALFWSLCGEDDFLDFSIEDSLLKSVTHPILSYYCTHLPLTTVGL